jgi:hypothetical protein
MVARSKIRFSGKGPLTRIELKAAIGEVREAIDDMANVMNCAFALLPSIVAIGDGN